MPDKLKNLLNPTNADFSFSQICSAENLYAAWRKVRVNRGSSGVDAVSLKNFEIDLQDNLTELSRSLSGEVYQPLPVKFVQVIKANGKMRELGILTVRDRVAQRAVLDAVEPRFESLMDDCSFAFRAGRNVEMAIRQIILARANGFWWTVEADIENYFGSINRETVLKDTCRVVADKKVLRLVELWLNAGILEETWWHSGQRKISQANGIFYEAVTESFDGFAAQRFGTADDAPDFSFEDETEVSPFEEEKTKTHRRREAVKKLAQDGFWLAVSHRALLGKIVGAKMLGVGGAAIAGLALAPKIVETYRQWFHPRKGILQGSPLSPVLANLYLTGFDKKFTHSDFRLARYCDDFVISCRTEADAQKALQTAEKDLAKRGLRLHPEKTRILSPTSEFEFLGYRFLSNGMVEPPPSASAALAKKIVEMSRQAKGKMKNVKFKVEKSKVKSWREFFDAFGKKEQ